VTDDAQAFSLRRWSQRKLAAAREHVAPTVPTVAPDASPTTIDAPAAASSAALPPVETLTFESDFAAFLHPAVDDGLRCAALRKLLRDPRFNVMDGLDVYIDDYSQPSPMSPALARALVEARPTFAGDVACATGHAAPNAIANRGPQCLPPLPAPATAIAPRPSGETTVNQTNTDCGVRDRDPTIG